MSELVSDDQIEKIVGTSRHKFYHYARAVSSQQTVYILHSQQCLDTHSDLRDCPHSLALDNGINVEDWIEDIPAIVNITDGQLVPRIGLTEWPDGEVKWELSP